MPPSRAGISASSITCGSSEWLPLVITAGPSSPAITRRCSGVVGSMNPKVERPGALPSGRRSGPSARSTTIGAAAPVSACSSSGAIVQ